MKRDLESLARRYRAERQLAVAEAIADAVVAVMKWLTPSRRARPAAGKRLAPT